MINSIAVYEIAIPCCSFWLFFPPARVKRKILKLRELWNGAKDATIYLYQRSLSGTLPVDSAVISGKGTFELRGFTGQPNFYILFIHKDQYINLLIHPGDKFHSHHQLPGILTVIILWKVPKIPV